MACDVSPVAMFMFMSYAQNLVLTSGKEGPSLFTLKTWNCVPKRPKKGEDTCQGLNGRFQKQILFTLSLVRGDQFSQSHHSNCKRSWAQMCPQCWLVRVCARPITAQDKIIAKSVQKNKLRCDWSIHKVEGGVQYSQKAEQTRKQFSMTFAGLKRRFKNP